MLLVSSYTYNYHTEYYSHGLVNFKMLKINGIKLVSAFLVDTVEVFDGVTQRR